MDDRPSFLGTYLTPIAPLFLRDNLVEVAINPDGNVWIERKGATHMERMAHLTIDRVLSNNLGHAIASAVGVQFSEKKPTVSGKIVWGDIAIRAQVVAPPVVEGGMAITFRPFKVAADQLIEPRLLHGGLVDLDARRRARAAEAMKFAEAGHVIDAMRLCVEERMNLLISGGTSTGKTTFARSLLSMVNPAERILTIEDAYELFPRQENAVALKADRSGHGERTPARLLEASLRMRPDRIILGELRGEESRTFLEAINTGHGGSFTTIHADTARKAIDRLAIMVMAAGLGMGFEEVKRYCEGSVDLVVQLSRQGGSRGVAEILCL
ncbi:Flp pilus assembly complex ATPase component TadA [Rhodobacteraceae bacterium HSP-20]|uniref:Flp pilus assembly complex ATPase component TadA n=1 Tax=Paragemmobacter amnigenus TaxID=2852097 RepID=A0ABS6JB65_9RHOB|nr:ATPase, T2SS/T4P/T4SS family [Rhodobacter amnigenus]MBU9699732.1 Flp pilus assembly complex ATPase component TadA [Rhodobacter amnigenus]MBV4390959.1 Flp pilus assembly complex ATPase component TadA [Rhodobacter amnigenus]